MREPKITESDALATPKPREDAAERRRSTLRLVASRPASEGDPEAAKKVAAPRPIHPSFMVRDAAFFAAHPRVIFSRLRRRGSYVFHC